MTFRFERSLRNADDVTANRIIEEGFPRDGWNREEKPLVSDSSDGGALR